MKRRGVSQFKGVTFNADKKKKQWRARITVDGVEIFLGRFETQEEAAGAYNRAALQHFKEFAHINGDQ